MSASADEPPVIRGGCRQRARMRWFEKLVVAAYRNGATVIRARAGQRFAFRFGGETRTIGTRPVREEDLLDRLGELLPKELDGLLRAGGHVEYEYVVLPWAPVRASIFNGVRGLVMSVRLGAVDEGIARQEPPPRPPLFDEGEMEIRPSERDIDRILRAAMTAGASQVLIKPRAPLALKIGTAFVRPGAHGLSADFVEKLLGEVLTLEERVLLIPDAEIQVEIGVCPFASCEASAFLGGGPDDLRSPLPVLTVEGCRREIVECCEECAQLHDRRVAAAAAVRRAHDGPGTDTRAFRLEALKWPESRRRSRRLIDRLRAVAGPQPDQSLETARAILREAVSILAELREMKPALPDRAAPEPAPAYPAAQQSPSADRRLPTTGYPLLNAGFVLGATELLLFEDEIPTYLIGGEPRRPSARPITRGELEEQVAAWESGSQAAEYNAPAGAAHLLRFEGGEAVRIVVNRANDRLQVSVLFLEAGHPEGGKGAGSPAPLPKHPPHAPRPFLRALPPETREENPP
ncbi:MAG: hypothetical protein FD180_4729 [Planctomycetota bacterium]|nr:MAG: hypothetical protein FD180_4729 [Planctomycetota bacterium]